MSHHSKTKELVRTHSPKKDGSLLKNILKTSWGTKRKRGRPKKRYIEEFGKRRKDIERNENNGESKRIIEEMVGRIDWSYIRYTFRHEEGAEKKEEKEKNHERAKYYFPKQCTIIIAQTKKYKNNKIWNNSQKKNYKLYIN